MEIFIARNTSEQSDIATIRVVHDVLAKRR